MTEIETYDSRKPGTMEVFFKVVDGAVVSVIIGNKSVSKDRGYQFYVEDYVAEQLDKCELMFDGVSPKLKLREGETLDVPIKTEKELEIERLRRELEALEEEGQEENAD